MVCTSIENSFNFFLNVCSRSILGERRVIYFEFQHICHPKHRSPLDIVSLTPIFEKEQSNFMLQTGWTHHLIISWAGGGGGWVAPRQVPRNSTGTGLTDHMHLRFPTLNPGAGRVCQNSSLQFNLCQCVIIFSSQSH